jgi:hypothetical protein
LEKERFQLDFRLDIETAPSFALGDLDQLRPVIGNIKPSKEFWGRWCIVPVSRSGRNISPAAPIINAIGTSQEENAASPDWVGWSQLQNDNKKS